MRRIEDIEKMSLEELESIGMDERAQVPSDLQTELRAGLLANALQSGSAQMNRRRTPVLYGVYALVPLALALFLVLMPGMSRPKDTFSDPALAYAELEKAFDIISAKANEGLELAGRAEMEMNKAIEVYNR